MQAKTLNLALHLDPSVSKADTAALAVLQQWYAQAKQNHGNGSDGSMDDAVRQFHHDVYLAGLQIHLIGSQLCGHLATALQDRSTSIDALLQQLEASGLWRPQQAAPQAEQNALFSAAQLEQMAQVIAQAPTPTPTPVEPERAEKPAGDETAVFAEYGNTLGVILDELKQLRALTEQQSAELSKLRLENQRMSVSEPSTAPGTEELSVAEMAPQLAQMQKIREKGVF